MISPARTKLTPPELAARWGIDCHKVLQWIRSGELKAIDAATKLGGRPRFLIDESDIAAFELRRTVGGSAPTPRRRRAKDKGIIEFIK